MSPFEQTNLDIDAALNQVVERESQVRAIPLLGPVQVELCPGANRIWVKVAGMVIEGKLTAGLIHQLGSWVWPNQDRSATAELWKKNARNGLAQRLAAVLSNSGLVLRYRETENGLEIYGLTSSKFVEMDQRHFRKVLVEAMRPLGIAPSGDVFETAFKEVVEEFKLPPRKGAVGLTCRVIYGLNTGYSSYRLRWGRVILVCTNGMTSFEGVARDRWLHSGDVEIARFVDASVHGAYDHLSLLERKIVAACDRRLDDDRVDQFLARLVLAKATKHRIVGQLDAEFQATGRNEWSLSQALTYLGTHERAIPPRVRNHLTRLGSEVVDGSLDAVTSAKWINPTARAYESQIFEQVLGR